MSEANTPANKAPEKVSIDPKPLHLTGKDKYYACFTGSKEGWVPYVPLSRVEALEARVKELEGALRRCRKQAVEKISFRAAREAE